MKIVIPTYQRYHIKTVDLLEREGLTATLYVANQEEYDKYKANYPDYEIIIGVKGIRAQREFIQSQYPEGTILLSMDDDIEDFTHSRGLDMNEWIEECEIALRESKSGMLTFSASSNPYFCGNFKIKEGRYLCCAFVYMFKVDHSITGEEDIDSAEDYDRSMMYLKKYGSILRYGDIVFKTKFWAPGGMSDQRTKESYLHNVNKLLAKYPDDLYVNIKKSGKMKGLPNIKIRAKPASSLNK
jgi:hypothetical protein